MSTQQSIGSRGHTEEPGTFSEYPTEEKEKKAIILSLSLESKITLNSLIDYMVNDQPLTLPETSRGEFRDMLKRLPTEQHVRSCSSLSRIPEAEHRQTG